MIPEFIRFNGEQAIAQMDVGHLEKIVNRLYSAPVKITDWQVTLLGGLDSSPMAGGVYLVEGKAVYRSLKRPAKDWRVVVKILRSPEGLPLPDGTFINREMAEYKQGFGYWQREALAAQSDLLDELPFGLHSPRCLGITHISETECWLWLEYIDEDHVWDWDDYYQAAFRLGQWQASTVKKQHSYHWLSQKWMEGWVNGVLTVILGIFEQIDGWKHPLIAAYFAPEELEDIQRLWHNKDCYLNRLTQLPKTLCHLDAYRANMRWQGDKLTLLDWAFVGEGALGEELAAFVGATLLLDHMPLADAEKLEEIAFEGYLSGLRAAGWTGNEAQIVEAYRCAMPLRYAPMSLVSMLRTAVQPEFAAEWERKTGKPLEDILAHRAGLIRFYLSRIPVCQS